MPFACFLRLLCSPDGDGHISADDLHASLARVSICSPRSRCVLRTRQDVVGQLLARIDMDGSR
jgi:solute carrier family 25 phosphate transporter 23/24/25/41